SRLSLSLVSLLFVAVGVVILILSVKCRPALRLYDNGLEYASPVGRRWIPFSEVQTAYTYSLQVQTGGAGGAVGSLTAAAVSGMRTVFWSRVNGSFKALELDRSYSGPDLAAALKQAFASASGRAVEAVKKG